MPSHVFVQRGTSGQGANQGIDPPSPLVSPPPTPHAQHVDAPEPQVSNRKSRTKQIDFDFGDDKEDPEYKRRKKKKGPPTGGGDPDEDTGNAEPPPGWTEGGVNTLVVTLDPDEVAEGEPIGTTVGTLSVDVSASGLTYTLVSGAGDTDNADFAIDGDEVQTAAILSLGDGDTRSIRVRARSVADDIEGVGVFEISVTGASAVPEMIAIAPILGGAYPGGGWDEVIAVNHLYLIRQNSSAAPATTGSVSFTSITSFGGAQLYFYASGVGTLTPDAPSDEIWGLDMTFDGPAPTVLDVDSLNGTSELVLDFASHNLSGDELVVMLGFVDAVDAPAGSAGLVDASGEITGPTDRALRGYVVGPASQPYGWTSAGAPFHDVAGVLLDATSSI